ncbi:MaoC family dehydratase [Rhizorhapis sp. SPR117]|uniref:MaoC family dehydratase n=1 Tax=Rhizorhapis sp. SPR117 TaxID=2912611 RepID=UPI001F39109C|nr:MaoC family dehydratase [Rhizorhapis sp. SPR117]
MQYFEDIEVGTRASFGGYSVTRKEVLDFAERYDPQPFHLSDEEAAKTHFGRIAASGWHTCAMMMAMYVTHMKQDEHAGLGAAGVDEVRWLKPVYPGDTLRCETEVLEKTASRSRPEMGSFRSRMTVFNQHDMPVLTFISIGLIKRRPME